MLIKEYRIEEKVDDIVIRGLKKRNKIPEKIGSNIIQSMCGKTDL